jgi:hypothetical protein
MPGASRTQLYPPSGDLRAARRLNVLLHQQLGPQDNLNLSYLTDETLARELDRVGRLSGEARYRGYARLSVEIARDLAPWVPYSVGTSRDFFSARMGCQLFHPVFGIDLGALCTRPARP